MFFGALDPFHQLLHIIIRRDMDIFAAFHTLLHSIGCFFYLLKISFCIVQLAAFDRDLRSQQLDETVFVSHLQLHSIQEFPQHLGGRSTGYIERSDLQDLQCLLDPPGFQMMMNIFEIIDVDVLQYRVG